jgi:hypothetical protein
MSVVDDEGYIAPFPGTEQRPLNYNHVALVEAPPNPECKWAPIEVIDMRKLGARTEQCYVVVELAGEKVVEFPVGADLEAALATFDEVLAAHIPREERATYRLFNADDVQVLAVTP